MLDKNPKSAIWPSLGVAGHSMSFYAVCALLVLSLVSRGTLAADAIALYGTFIAAAYLSPFLGSWLSLRLGLRLTVVLGAVLAAMGVVGLVLASRAARPSLSAGQVWLDWGLSGGLGCLALGVGLIKPNLVTLVTRLFPSGSPLVDPALARYYAFTNGGAIAGPLVAGYCAVHWGYATGFAVAIWGEVFLLGAMLLGWRSLAAAESLSSLAPFGVSVSAAAGGAGDPAGPEADPVGPRTVRSALAILVPFFLLATVGFWPAYHQNGTGLTIWAQQHTVLDVWDFHIPPAWFASINSVMCVLLSVPLSRMFSGSGTVGSGGSQADRSSLVIPIGYALMSLSFVVLLVAARIEPVVSPLWLVGSIVLSTLSELAVSIGGLSRVAKVTPRRYMPLAMSCWYATVALGGLIAGQAGRLPLLSSFVMCSALSACAALVYLLPSVVSVLRSALGVPLPRPAPMVAAL
jgi:POT family proton-dependent oligopeptide transporter